MKKRMRAAALILIFALLLSNVGTTFATENVEGTVSEENEEIITDSDKGDAPAQSADSQGSKENVGTAGDIADNNAGQDQPEAAIEPEQSEDTLAAKEMRATFTITDEAQLTGLFPDANFRKAVFKEVAGLSGAELKDALASFDGTITAKNKGIKDIQGIQWLIHAEKINLDHNEIQDLSFLGGLGDRWYGYGIAESLYGEAGNVEWSLGGNPLRQLPATFGGRLVIDQPATMSSHYTGIVPEEKRVYVRNNPGEAFSGTLDIRRCEIDTKAGKRYVKILDVNPVKPAIVTVSLTSNESASYAGLRRTGQQNIGFGTEQEIHYQTSDEYDTLTPGSQSFKYYLTPQFYVYDKVDIRTVNLGNVTLTKTDDRTGAALPGAVFSLYKKDNTLIASNLTTDRYGKISRSGLTDGSYYFKETAAPAGYKLNNEKREFTISTSEITPGITGGETQVETTDKGTQTAASQQVFIAGPDSPDIVLSVPAGVTVKSAKIDYKSLDTAATSVSGDAASASFTTLQAAQNDINAKKNANLITGPVSVQLEVTSNADAAVEVNATNEPDLVSVKGSKTWVDKIGMEDQHPTVTLRLSRDGQPYPNADNQQTIALPKGTTTYEFKDLPAYAPDGNKYTYTVSEDSVSGYTSERTKTKDGFDFKNTFINEYTEIHGTKTWIDEDGFDEMDVKHSPIKVWLTRSEDGGATFKRTKESVSLGDSKEKTEKYDFVKLPVYSPDGKTKYVYSIEESFVKEEDKGKYKEPKIIGNDIINTFANIKTKVLVRKVWDDKIEHTHRPDEITFRLLQDGHQMNDEDGKGVIRKLGRDETEVWFEDLPEYADNGKKYDYVVIEDAVDGYRSSSKRLPASKDIPVGYEFTNTRIADGTTSITAMKSWIDYEGWTGANPDIKFRVLQDGVENWDNGQVMEATLRSGDTQVIFDGLPKTDASGTKTWKYTVKEVPAEGYVARQVGNHITNVFGNAEKTDVTIKKDWVKKAGAAEPSITFHLLQDGMPYKDNGVDVTYVMPPGTTEHTFKDLPKYADNGKKHSYLVVEDTVEGYSGTSAVKQEETDTSSVTEYTFTNTFVNEYMDIPFTKTWIDKEDAVDLPSATFTLSRRLKGAVDNAWQAVATTELKHEAAEEKGAFTHLPVYAGAEAGADVGKPYEYKIEESEVQGYEVTREGNHFFNTFINEAVEISVDKIWNDAPGAEHPEIKIRLLRNGTEIERQTLSPGDTQCSFTDLQQYADDGTRYEYTIEEEPIEGYKEAVELSAKDANGLINCTITNTPVTSFSGKKTWKDDADASKKRPVEITINLLQNGEKIDSVKVSEKESWKYEFQDKEVFAPNGDLYTYTITEDAVKGYKTEIKPDGEIVNTLVPSQEPENPGKPGGSGKAKTGDTSAVLPLILLMSAAGICIAVLYGRKRNRRR